MKNIFLNSMNAEFVLIFTKIYDQNILKNGCFAKEHLDTPTCNEELFP